MKLLVTGATGFVGRAVCERWQAAGYPLTQTVRRESDLAGAGNAVFVPSLDARTDWRAALRGCDAVLHLAARVHVMRDTEADPAAVFRSINTDGTLRLAQQAAEAGIRRFVFVSSIKVNGESTRPGHPFTALQPAGATDTYGISKAEAEAGLRALAATTGMEIVIVRPPLVYGPGVRANFLAMMRWLQRGVPLPFASVTANRRSMVGLDNLVDLLVTCVNHPAAANQTFLVSDGEDLSTADLLRRLGLAMGKPARLFPVPPVLLQAGASLLGRGDMARRVLGNLQVDISHTRETLGWAPPVSVNEGLRRTCAGFLP